MLPSLYVFLVQLRVLLMLGKVRYSNERNCSFLAQNGGNGWASTFHISRRDIVINLRGINRVSFNTEKTQATIQGGTIVSEVVDAALATNTRLSTATCNCLGYLGAVLGGGLSRTMGLYGLGVDQLLSVNLVTSSGNTIHVDSKNPDLWWALRGAAANFGIVTSARVKAYPIPAANNTAWTGLLVFDQAKIEALVGAINDLDLKPEMEIDLYYATTGPPNYSPTVIALPFYVGTAAAGRAAFASVLAIGPATDNTSIVPYSQWNAGSTAFCIPGNRKPAYGVSMNRMDPSAWRSIWDKYVSFVAENPGTGNSLVLAECYSTYKARSLPSNSSSYPFRSIQYHAVAIPWYSDTSLDATANAFASSIRDLWRSTGNLGSNSSYVLALIQVTDEI